MTVLAVIMVLNAVVAAFYYLRVVVYMYMRDPKDEPVVVRHGGLVRIGLLVAAVATIVLGVLPGPLIDAASKAAQAVAGL